MVVPRFLVGVIGMICRSDGRILTVKRSSASKHFAGAWECVSGKVEEGEELIDALHREIREECGISAAVDPRPIDCFTTTHGNDPMLLVIYRCEHTAGEVVLSSEHDEYSWLPIDDFCQRISFQRLKQLARLHGATKVKP